MASTPSTRRQHDGVAVWSLTDRFSQHYRVHPPHWLISTQVHLVNDGVQNKEESYGKFEEGNKLSLTEFAARVEAPTDWLETTLVPVWNHISGAPRHRRLITHWLISTQVDPAHGGHHGLYDRCIS